MKNREITTNKLYKPLASFAPALDDSLVVVLHSITCPMLVPAINNKHYIKMKIIIVANIRFSTFLGIATDNTSPEITAVDVLGALSADEGFLNVGNNDRFAEVPGRSSVCRPMPGSSSCIRPVSGRSSSFGPTPRKKSFLRLVPGRSCCFRS